MQEPEFLYPGSNVMAPVRSLSLLISIDTSFSLPTTIGNSYLLPSNSNTATFDMIFMEFNFGVIMKQIYEISD